MLQTHSLQLRSPPKEFIQKKMIFKKTSALDKTFCTDHVDFGKNANRFGRISWYQIKKDNQKYLDVQLKVFRKDDKRDFRKHHQIKLAFFHFKQLLCLRYPVVLAVREFSTDETLQEIVSSPLSKNLDEQLKQVKNAITIVDRPKKKIISTMKRYCMDKP